jgi:hypothetical protein
MTHFFTLVLISGTTAPDDIEEAVKRLLAPFDANRPVTPYKVYLTGKGRERLAARYGIPADKLAAFLRSSQQGWEEDEHGLYRWRAVNPHARFDSCRIGGRWDGALRVSSGRKKATCPTGDKYERLGGNVLPVRQVNRLDHKLICHALVTPDGQWHERGTAGWWNVITNEKDESEWDREVATIFQRYQDHLLVGVDCHI